MSRRRAEMPRLFAETELALRPTGVALLRRAAARPSRGLGQRDLIQDENRRAMKMLRGHADELCERFDLNCKAIEKERDDVHEHYGVCYEDGLIRIRLRHARTGRLLKESSLVDTLCHELAHLRHLDHSIRFRRLYARILDEARRRGFYRPGQTGGRRAIQTTMFDDDDCGTERSRE